MSATTAKGDATGSSTAVGVAIALGFVNDGALATTDRNITADGAVTFSAKGGGSSSANAEASAAGASSTRPRIQGQQDADDQTAGATNTANSQAADGKSRSAGKSASTESGSVSVGAALAINVSNSNAIATTADGLTIVAGDGAGSGSLSVLAANHMDANAIAEGGAATKSGGTAVGAGIAINVAHMNNEGSIGAGSIITADGVIAEAVMTTEEADVEATTIPIVDIEANTIFLGANHGGFNSGDKVTYDNGDGTSIGGLSEGSTKYSVVVEDGGKIKLRSVDSEGNVGAVVDLTSVGSGTGHKLEHVVPTDSIGGALTALLKDDVSLDPATSRRIVTLDAGHGLRTGDAITYESGGSAMGGLVDGHTYYVILLEGNKAELAASVDDAIAGKAITLTSDGGSSQKVIDGTSSFRAEATSGASGGDTGVAASFALNYSKTNVQAVIGLDHGDPSGAVQLTLNGGDVGIHAKNITETQVNALPAGVAKGSDIGIGASVALNISLNNTSAQIENGEQVSGSAHDFLVSAESGNVAITRAEAGAAGSTSVGGAIAIAVVDNDTTARIGSGAGGSIALSGDLAADAKHSNIVHTKTAGEAAGGDVGVGIALALNIIDRRYPVGRGAQLHRCACRFLHVLVQPLDGCAGQGRRQGCIVRFQRRRGRRDQVARFRSGNQCPIGLCHQECRHDSAPAGNAQSGNLSKADSTATKQSSTGTKSDTGSSDSGGTSVAASVAVNFLEAKNTVTIAGGVTIVASEAMDVSATATADASAQGIATATNTDADTGVAAAVGVNIALLSNTATVGDGAHLTADDIDIEAVMIGSETNNFQSRALAGAAASGTAIGGSVSVNYIDQDTNATVADNAVLNATAGNIDVAAESHNTIQNLAGGAAISTEGDTGVGIAIAVNIVNGLDTNASIGDADATASGSISVTADATLLPKEENIPIIGTVAVTSFAAGIAGSTGGTVVGGSSSVNVISVGTHALIEGDATILAGQNVKVEATDQLTVFSAAGGLAASTGGSGVGIGIDVGVITRSTTAIVGDGADVTATSGSITVNADSDDDITSIAGSFGVSGGDLGLAGSISVQVVTTETKAYSEDTPSGPGGTMNAGGDVSVTADSDFKALMIAGALGASSSLGLGVSNTTLVHNDTVEARIGDRNIVTSAGAIGVKVEATSTEEILAITAAGGAASSVGISVAPTINVLNENTHASVGRGATVNAQSPGISNPDVVVKASDDTTIVSIAGSIGAAGSVGVAVGADVLSLIKKTSAHMDSGVTSLVDGDIDVSATSDEDITSVAAGIAVGGTAGVGVNASVHVLDLTTRAFIGDDPDSVPASLGAGNVHAGGTVRIAADDRTELDKFVATVAVGGSAGVGAAATVTVITKNTEAFIGNGASVTGDGKTDGLDAATGAFEIAFQASPAGTDGLEATSAKDQDVGDLQNAGEVGAPDVDGVDYNDDGSTDANPATSGQRVLSPNQATVKGVAVAATSRDDIETYSAAIGGGTVGVAVAAAVNVINTDTQAYIGDGASVNFNQGTAGVGQSVTVAAGSDFHHVALAAGAGFGAVGVAPGVDVTVLTANTGATIGTGAIVKAKDDVRVDAHASEDILLVGMGIAAGTVGVGGGVSVLSLTTDTNAAILGTVSAGGDVAVRASDDSNITVISGALGAGFVGVGASVGVMVMDKDTSAFVADNAHVDALGNGTGESGILDGTMQGGDAANGFNTGTRHGMMVQAQSSEEILHIGVAAGAGFVGVSGAVNVSVIDSDTQAYIGNADINQTGANAGANANQGVYVGASNEARVITFTGAVAGGFVGVGGAVNVGVLKNDINAKIRNGAVVTARNDVEVNAMGIKEIDGFVISGAGGFVGVAGAVSVWSIGSTLERDYSDADGNSGNAMEREKEGGGTDTADADAARQGQAASGKVSSELGGFDSKVSSEKRADGNQSSDERLADITKAGANKLATSSPSAAAVTAKLAESEPVTTGTAATIEAGSQVTTTSGDIVVNANEDLEYDVKMGGVAGGVVGVGAAIGITSISSNVSATAGGSLNAGGQVTVKSKLDEDAGVLSVAGAVGFVGLGAAVIVISDDSTNEAKILDNASVQRASAVNVLATSNQTVSAQTIGVSVGAVGAGASFIQIDVDGSTGATIGTNANIGTTDSVGSVNINASSTVDAQADVFAIAGGAAAFSFNFAFIDVDPTIAAGIGAGTDVVADGNVSITSASNHDADGSVFSVSTGGGAFGTSWVEVKVRPTVDTYIGGSATVTAGGAIALLAVHNRDVVSYSPLTTSWSYLGNEGAPEAVSVNRGARAYGEAPSVGGIVGNGSIIRATSAANVETHVDANSRLKAGGAVKLEARTVNDARVRAQAESLSFASVGGLFATAKSEGVTRAQLNGSVRNVSGTASAADSVTVRAQTLDIANSEGRTTNGSIGGDATDTEAKAFVTPTIEASIGTNSVVRATGAILVSAESQATAHTIGRGTAIGLGGSFGAASATSTITSNVDSKVNTGAVLAGGSISVEAFHNYTTGGSSLNQGATSNTFAPGGAIAAIKVTKATATSNANVEAVVEDGASLSATGALAVRAFNHNLAQADARGITVGAVGVGVTVTNATANGSTRAHMDGDVTGGGSLTVRADQRSTATATTRAVAGGLFVAVGGNVAQATANPIVEAYIASGSNVTVGGAVSVNATGIVAASSSTEGISAGSIGIGVSFSGATASPHVTASVGSPTNSASGNVTINAGSLAVNAKTQLPSGAGSYAAKSTATGSAGGLIGVDATVTEVTNNAQVKAYVGDGSHLPLVAPRRSSPTRRPARRRIRAATRSASSPRA